MHTPQMLQLLKKWEGYSRYKTKVRDGYPVIFWYHVEPGDRAENHPPYVDHCFVTRADGSPLQCIKLSDKEIDQLEDAALKAR